MSTDPVHCDQDLLDACILKHASYIGNFGQYENMSRPMAVLGKGLAALGPLLHSILEVSPYCNISISQLRESILQVDKLKDLNKTKLQDKVWAGQRAERLVTLMSHLRRLWRVPYRKEQCFNKCSKEARDVIQELLQIIVEKPKKH